MATRFSPTNSIGPAMDRTVKQLFSPFRWKFWLKMALVVFISGEMASTNTGVNWNMPSGGGRDWPKDAPDPFKALHDMIDALHKLDPHILWTIGASIATLMLIGLAITAVFWWLSANFRFIFFQSVLTGECRIGESWSRYQRAGWRYFAFVAVFALIAFAGFLTIIGIPLWTAIKHDLFHRENLAQLLGLLAAAVALLMLFALIAWVIHSVARDFVVPFMALDEMPLGDAWSRALGLLRMEPGAFAGYLGMKFLLTIVAGIGMGVVFVVLFLIVLIPSAIVALLLAFLIKGGGAAAIAIGVTFMIIGIFCLIAFVLAVAAGLAVPVAMFFQSYALYFLSSRYDRLAAVMFPRPAPPVLPAPAI